METNNITGTWIYSEDFGFGNDKGKAVLKQDGKKVTGAFEYTERIDDEEPFEVRQMIEGDFDGELLEIKGVSVELSEGCDIVYNLDEWEGRLTEEGKIVGSSFDAEGLCGVFVLERE